MQSPVSLARTLVSHSAGVHTLAISSDGQTLLSGGNDGYLTIWDLRTGERLQLISCVFHGPISCIAWISSEENDISSFVFGCADGSIQIYQRLSHSAYFEYVSQEIGHDGAVQNLAFDNHHNRIATMGENSLQVWNLVQGKFLSPMLETPPSSKYKARTVHFCEDGASLVVTYLESHQVVCYTIEPWGIKWSKQIPTRIGQAVLLGHDLFVSNLVNGVDQYTIPTMERVNSFPHAIIQNYPMQIAIAKHQDWIVSGGDDGFARIFDSRTGKFLQRLDHGDGELVQTVTARSDDHNCIIITASTGEGESSIKVWLRENGPAPPKESSATRVRGENMSHFQILLLVVITTFVANFASIHLTTLMNKSFWMNIAKTVAGFQDGGVTPDL